MSEQEDEWRARHVDGHRPGALPLLRVRYLGVWDTVGSLGIPRYIVMANTINRMHQFHDVSLSPMVEQARHAVAIDEHRVDFEPALWENLRELNLRRGANPESADAPYQQMWFPGGHGSVGGGGDRRGLSDLALEWIWDGARQAGLELDASPQSHLNKLASSHTEDLVNKTKGRGFNAVNFVLDRLPRGHRQPGPERLHEISPVARRRWKERPENLPDGQAYRPATLQALAGELDLSDEAGAAADTVAGNFTIYIARPGDTLESIAGTAYGDPTKSAVILRANSNKLVSASDLQVGQALRLPGGRDPP